MSEPQNPLPPVRLPEHIIAQLRWLIDNPWHVGAAAALADELATWVATSPGSRPLYDFFDSMKRQRTQPGVLNRILRYFSDSRPPVDDWDGLLAIDPAAFLKEPGVGWATLAALARGVAFCGVMPPPGWVGALQCFTGRDLKIYFEELVRGARESRPRAG